MMLSDAMSNTSLRFGQALLVLGLDLLRMRNMPSVEQMLLMHQLNQNAVPR